MHQHKDLYTVDFRNVQHYLDMHFEIKRALEFPDYYGCNWDAFWDCLTDMYGDPIHIEILGMEVIEEKFDGVAEKMITILRRFLQDEDFGEGILIEIVRKENREVLT